MRDVIDDRSLGDLFNELRDQTRTLISQEVRLAKTEAAQKGKQAGKAVGFLAVGGFVIYAGLLAIIAGIILVLGQVVPVWVAALVVGVIVALIGYLVLQKGLSDLKADKLKPEKTLATMRENKEWLQTQAK
ncbi:MAG: phage holin family protein [Nitrososphaerales archaeon]